MCSPSRNPLPPPSPSHPQGHPIAPALSTLSHASNLVWQYTSHMIIYTFQCYPLKSSHPRPLPQSPKDCSLHLRLFCCLAFGSSLPSFQIPYICMSILYWCFSFCISLWPHGLQSARFLHTWDFPGKNTGMGCHFLLQGRKVKSESEVTQLCPTLHDPMDCSPPGSSIHGIFQARVLEWGAIAFSQWSITQPLKRIHLNQF